MQEFFQNDKSVDSNRILYTTSPFAREDLLHLQEIGSLKAIKPHTSQRSNLESFLFFVVKDGEGTLGYGDREYILHPGDCVFIDCRLPYYHSTDKSLWSLSWIHFNGPSMQGIYQKYIERGGSPVFSPKNLHQFTEAFDALFSICTTSDYLKDMRINEHLSGLLTKIMEHSWNPESEQPTSIKRGDSMRFSLNDVRAYLDDHFKEGVSLEELSENFYINKYHLARIFKKYYGDTILNYIIKLRITASKELLRFTSYSIDAISEQCGFEDANYFSRVFKKIEGISPSEYRRRW